MDRALVRMDFDRVMIVMAPVAVPNAVTLMAIVKRMLCRAASHSVDHSLTSHSMMRYRMRHFDSKNFAASVDRFSGRAQSSANWAS